jgi:hypothetical protein
MSSQPLQVTLLILAGDSTRDTITELLTRQVAFGITYIPADELHTVSPVAPEKAEPSVCLRGRAVDDCYIIACNNNPVLTFLFRVFGNNRLFYNIHESHF